MTDTLLGDILTGILTLLATTITAMGAIIVARQGTLRKEVAAVRFQVQNDHGTNLRDDLDHKDNRQMALLTQIVDLCGWLAQGWVENRQDITELNEDTGRGQTRRARRLAASRPPVIQYSDLPERGTP